MTTPRKSYSAEFKARVALEALKGHKTVNESASAYRVHPTQIATWEKHLQSELPQLFSTRRQTRKQEHEDLQAQLSQQIGQLKVELDWLKKNLDFSPDTKRRLIEPDHRALSIARQCELLGLSRGSYYYTSAGESGENVHVMHL